MLSLHTNASSLTTMNSMASTNKSLGATMAKLGSGYRVNSAMDDAAGLQIATRLNAQSRGMQVAQKNTQNGISMLQTAEGAMGEINNMLLRMKDLASEAANGTSSDEDKAAMQAEYDALGEEMNNILSNTSFAGSKLFANNKSIGGALGERTGITFQVGATAAETVNFKAGATGGSLAKLLGNLTKISSKIDIAATAPEEVTDANKGAITLALAKDTSKDLTNITLADVEGFEGDEIAFQATVTKLTDEKAAEDLAKTQAAEKVAKAAFDAALTERKAAISAEFSATVGLADMLDSNGDVNTSVLTDTAVFGSTTEEVKANVTKVVELMKQDAVDSLATTLKSSITGVSNGVTEVDGATLAGFTTQPDYVTLGLKDANGAATAFSDAITAVQDERKANIKTAIQNKLDADPTLTLDTIVESASGLGAAAYMGNAAKKNELFNTAIAEMKADKLTEENTKLAADKKAAAEAAVAKANANANAVGEISGNKANATIDALSEAISAIGTFRSDLGAVANRLENTFNNLGNMITNTDIAKGRIMDVDYAKESAAMTKNQMLMQVSTSMLKQSNSLSQMVGSLVQ